MPGKPKVTAREKQKAVERYMVKDATVRDLAKEHDVSEQAIYLWVKEAKADAVEAARVSHMSPRQLQQDSRINKDLRIMQLEDELSKVKTKLFEYMLKHEEI
jgi:transposase-like protein